VAPAPSATASSDEDHTAILLGIVAEKTGYPEDMLEMEMSLEGDLGIDSIKRVEIFSALQQSIPAVSNVQQDTMFGLSTLQEIVDFLAQAGGTASGSKKKIQSNSTSAPMMG